VSELAASSASPSPTGSVRLPRAGLVRAGAVGGDASLRRPDITEFVKNFDRGQYPDLVAGDVVPVAA
jgi:hypothetical protein